MSGPKPLTSRCSDCFKPGSAYFPKLDQYYCAEHAQQVLLWDASRDHLLELVDAPFEVWVGHWRERGFSNRDLREALDEIELHLVQLLNNMPAENPKHEAADLPHALQQAA